MDYEFYTCPYDDNISCKRLPSSRCAGCPIRTNPARLTKQELAEAITKSVLERHDRNLMRGDE